MRYLDLTLADAADNLALDEALLLGAESGEGGEVLRVWEVARPVVVLGAGCKWAETPTPTSPRHRLAASHSNQAACSRAPSHRLSQGSGLRRFSKGDYSGDL